MRTLHHIAILGAAVAVLGFAGAEAAPFQTPGGLFTPGAVPPSLVQYSHQGHPDWYYGPKWGGYNSSGYRWSGRSVGYGSNGRRGHRHPHWYYGPKWGGFGSRG